MKSLTVEEMKLKVVGNKVSFALQMVEIDSISSILQVVNFYFLFVIIF